MFTGLVEEVGRLKSVSRQGEAMVITVGATIVTKDVKLGDSIAVNGVCLTVTSFDRSSFSVDVMPETYRKSSLNELKTGEPINLERAMQAGARFGGHIVQGHVDGIGHVLSRKVDANAVVFTIRLEDPKQLRYIIPKGSVTIDGISLTVVDTTEDGFTVSIIPHTLAETALQNRRIGETVNIESDIIGKYVDHLLHFREPESQKRGETSKLSTAYLAEHGFL
ncbi:riboflavin synthase [Paenibacillus sp. GSMTC-2017]|uniref:riboflavin synthase n=1 Tax=Paenibacillus sp. GSMTC-2017 TaxID=2794350 RepID=UPI0018D71CBE|nr:riboflavin synthase [Paenibacillus sp. GSMTC-2017]MBH5318010.1 riboflavin synthase [Paenibacillus sp. GSMTC-2017]